MQYDSYVLLAHVISYGKVSRSVLETILFYSALRNMDKIKYDCDFTDGEIEE